MRADVSQEEQQAVRRHVRRAIVGGVVTGGLVMVILFPAFAQAPRGGSRITIETGQYKVISKIDDSSPSGENLYRITFEKIPDRPYSVY